MFELRTMAYTAYGQPGRLVHTGRLETNNQWEAVGAAQRTLVIMLEAEAPDYAGPWSGTDLWLELYAPGGAEPLWDSRWREPVGDEAGDGQ